MIRRVVCGILCAALLHVGAGAADFHRVFEDRCLSCHGHAGDFARNALTDEDSTLVGVRSGRPVAEFLRRHAGGLSPSEISLLVETFRRQLGSGAYYRRNCDICHDRAYELARLRLILQDGKLMGRYSGRDMAVFLNGHARMIPTEARKMLDLLTTLRAGIE